LLIVPEIKEVAAPLARFNRSAEESELAYKNFIPW